MVKGIDTFRNYFADYSNSYIIIGGTACDLIISQAQLAPRATKDIDIILLVEALSSDFAKQFWKFIANGNYSTKEKSSGKKIFFRFNNPGTPNFPQQIELFSKIPGLLDIADDSIFTPIPLYDDLSSLSAILLNEEYYNYTLSHCTVEDNLNRANIEALICLKAKAFLDLSERKSNGENIDEKKIRKHKSDIFRLAVLITPDSSFELPEAVKSDLQSFVDIVRTNLPEKSFFKEMGTINENPANVFDNFLKSFILQ